MLNIYRSCTLTEDVLVGDNTQISDHTTVTKSMIGDNCDIGNNVTIRGSQIMNNVVIKDNCKITNTFIDDNVVVEENCVLEAGAILAASVHVKSDHKLKGNIIESDDKQNGMYTFFNLLLLLNDLLSTSGKLLLLLGCVVLNQSNQLHDNDTHAFL